MHFKLKSLHLRAFPPQSTIALVSSHIPPGPQATHSNTLPPGARLLYQQLFDIQSASDSDIFLRDPGQYLTQSHSQRRGRVFDAPGQLHIRVVVNPRQDCCNTNAAADK